MYCVDCENFEKLDEIDEGYYLCKNDNQINYAFNMDDLKDFCPYD